MGRQGPAAATPPPRDPADDHARNFGGPRVGRVEMETVAYRGHPARADHSTRTDDAEITRAGKMPVIRLKAETTDMPWLWFLLLLTVQVFGLLFPALGLPGLWIMVAA